MKKGDEVFVLDGADVEFGVYSHDYRMADFHVAVVQINGITTHVDYGDVFDNHGEALTEVGHRMGT